MASDSARPRKQRRPQVAAPATRSVSRRTSLRDELLESTTAIIREEGLGFVSLRAVARRASASHGAPAYHFRSKAGLLTAYAAQGYLLLVELVRGGLARAGDDPRVQLQTVGRVYVRFAIENPEQFGIMFRRELHEEHNAELDEAANQAISILGDIIKRCVSEGYLARERAETASIAAWSLTHGLAVLWEEGRLPARFQGRDAVRVAGDVVELFVGSLMPDPPTAERAPRAEPKTSPARPKR